MPHQAEKQQEQQLVFIILIAISLCHLINDALQAILISVYPLLKESFGLSFTQIGIITLVYQITASLLQPLVGLYTDKKPKPYSLAIGMGFTLIGLLMLAHANNFYVILLAAATIGTGSSIFHPESSRIARAASGGKHGFAQSFFQVGGNTGTALGPLLVAFIILPNGIQSVEWFALLALIGIIILSKIGNWYKNVHLKSAAKIHKKQHNLSQRQVVLSLVILIALVFSKFFYTAGISSYFIFYLVHKFNISVASAQIHLFIFLIFSAIGTLFGGVIGDRYGRRIVMWISIVGVLPFTLILPYADMFWTTVLSAVIPFILSSAFSAILVYAQELIPSKTGTISGFFFGLAFGVAGIGAAVLGWLADTTSIEFVYHACSFLPAIGLLMWFLPKIEKHHEK